MRINDNTAPWREAATRTGYRSSGGFSMVASGETAAILSVDAAEAGYVETEEISLVCRLAADVSFGRESLMRESALRESERPAQGQRFWAMLAAVSDASIAIDPLGRIELVNAEAEWLFCGARR